MTHIVLLLFTYWCACASAKSEHYISLEDAAIHFEEFIAKFNKEYADEHEKKTRFEIFKTNLVEVNRLNEKSKYAEYGITKFMDFTPEEITTHYTGLRNDFNFHFCDIKKKDNDIPDEDVPEAFDWRDENVVTAVKSQGLCGSCWAFSATGHIESLHAIKHNELLVLSEQLLIDCDNVSRGCQGGEISSAFIALKQIGGSVKEDDYHYDGQRGPCRIGWLDDTVIVVNVTDCISYDLNSQEKVKQLLHKVGPVPIAVRGAPLIFYKNGILSDDDCNGTSDSVNHAVLLVGYGTEKQANGSTLPYWVVKNSWDKSFGEDGYFRMERDGSSPQGACGMLNPFIATAIVD